MAGFLQGHGLGRVRHGLLAQLLLWTSLLILTVASAHTDCYWPDGSLNPNHYPCPGVQAGLCCEDGDMCLDNLVCQRRNSGIGNGSGSGTDSNQIAELYRGSCIFDEYMGSNNCPTFCSSNPDREVAMVHCSDDIYMCKNPALPPSLQRCNGIKGIVEYATLTGGTAIWATVDAQFLQSSSTTANGNPLPTSLTNSSQEDTSILLTASGTPIAPSTISIAVATVSAHHWESSATANPTPTAPSGATTPPDAPANGPSSAVPIAIGASIGGIAIVSAVVTAVLFLRKRRRQTPARAETPPPAPPAARDGGAGAAHFDFGFGLDPQTTRIIDGHQRYPTIPRIDGRDATLYRGMHPAGPMAASPTPPPPPPPMAQIPLRKEARAYHGPVGPNMSVELPC